MADYILDKSGVGEIAQTVKEFGFCIIRNYFSKENCDLLKKEFDAIYEYVPDGNTGYCDGGNARLEKDFPAGKGLRISSSFYPNMPVLSSLFFNDSKLSNQVDEYYDTGCDKFLQTFSSREIGKVQDDDLGRQAWMHVDPYASFKYATFLTKTTPENGALRVIPGSREEGKRIREEWMWKTDKKGLQGGHPHRLVDFPPEMVTVKEEDAVYVECDLGDLVAIDTDVFHAGGDIKVEGETRTAIYVHSRPL
tara:strand:- start:4091 stop:4840 length:750 start_codon:yes stop_codon:yes gene_type:complete